MLGYFGTPVPPRWFVTFPDFVWSKWQINKFDFYDDPRLKSHQGMILTLTLSDDWTQKSHQDMLPWLWVTTLDSNPINTLLTLALCDNSGLTSNQDDNLLTLNLSDDPGLKSYHDDKFLTLTFSDNLELKSHKGDIFLTLTSGLIFPHGC